MRNRLFQGTVLIFVIGMGAMLAHSQILRRRIERKIEERQREVQHNGASARVATHPATSCGAAPNLGFSIQTFSSGLRAGVWYPTTSADSRYQYASGFSTALARDANVSD